MKSIVKKLAAMIAMLSLVTVFFVCAPMATAEETAGYAAHAYEEAYVPTGYDVNDDTPMGYAATEDTATGCVATDYTAVTVENDRNAVKDAQQQLEDEVNKSKYTQKTEKFLNNIDVVKPIRDKVNDMVDKLPVGSAEKELLKSTVKQGMGILTGECLPYIGTLQKGIQAVSEFQKAKDATTTLSTVYHAVLGVEKTADAILTTIPGGGAAVMVKETVKNLIFYGLSKIL